jgi:hypothetical protein
MAEIACAFAYAKAGMSEAVSAGDAEWIVRSFAIGREAIGEPKRGWEDFAMYKLMAIILAAIPAILFLRNIFMGQLKRSQAVSDFSKQIDYLVWMILILIGCGLVYSIGKLILPEGMLYHFQG